MDTFMDVAILVVWFLFIFVVPKIFSKKKKETKYEYPEFPEDKETSDTKVEVSEEERKLKEWLENVFGGGKRTPSPVPSAETEESDDNKECDTPSPVCLQAVNRLNDKDERFAFVKEDKSPIVAVAQQRCQCMISKEQLVYGVVMAEVLGKPRSLRYGRRNFHANNM